MLRRAENRQALVGGWPATPVMLQGAHDQRGLAPWPRHPRTGTNVAARTALPARTGTTNFAPTPEAGLIIIQNLFALLFVLLDLYKWALILSAIISTLMSFGVLDSRNRIVWSIADFLYKITEPALRPIRAVLPSFNGVDLSPLVALLLLQYVVGPVLLQLELAILGGARGGFS
jgi:YggT family protein